MMRTNDEVQQVISMGVERKMESLHEEVESILEVLVFSSFLLTGEAVGRKTLFEQLRGRFRRNFQILLDEMHYNDALLQHLS